MKITEVACHVLLAPNFDPRLTSSAQDSFVVTIETDEGITGIGEADVNPWIAKACIEAPGTHTMGLCLREMLLGHDPLDIGTLWRRMYVGSAMNGRRGAVIHAMSAIDMALWDLRGKAEGKPVYELLGGRRQDHVVPYASLQPRGDSFEAYRDSLCEWALSAKALGFRAVKTEVTMNGPYAHSGLHEPYERHTEVVAAVRETIGPDIALLVDVQYLWEDAATALETVREWEAYDIFFLETPIWTDHLDEYAKLAASTSIPIAAGEWLATHWEFEELIARAGVAVVQPDVGRVGGFTEAMKVCAMAEERALHIVPHCWKTGISAAATAHLAFHTPNCPYIEYLPPQLCLETLRKELAHDNLTFRDGRIAPPERPGIGIDLDWDVLERFRVA